MLRRWQAWGTSSVPANRFEDDFEPFFGGFGAVEMADERRPQGFSSGRIHGEVLSEMGAGSGTASDS